MARVNVYLSDDLLSVVDQQAKAQGISRSALIQAALSSFLRVRQNAREQEARQRR